MTKRAFEPVRCGVVPRPLMSQTNGVNEMKMPDYSERYLGAAGIVPQFLNLDDPRPAQEQIHEAYAHGGGWHEFEGFTPHIKWDEPWSSFLTYPGDPPMKAKAYITFRDELVILFDSDWCAIAHPERKTRIARLD